MRSFVLLLMPYALFAQNLVIPDPFLKACIVSQYDSNGDGEISLAESANVTQLECSDRDIQSLDGLEQFPLTNLNVNANQITSVAAIAQLSNLEDLEMGENLVSELPALSGLTHLRHFYCGSNRLTALPQLPASLLELNCSGNALTSLPELPKTLRVLRCDWNELAEAPNLEQMVNLTDLSLGHNPFRGLPALSNLVELEFLDIEGLGIQQLPDFSPFTKLTGLYIGENPLTGLPNFANMNLTYLGIGRLGLAEFPDIRSQSNLAVLYANENQFTEVDVIAGLTKLEFVNISQNQLSHFPSMKGFNSLCCLFLNDNLLKELPELEDTASLQIAFFQDNLLDYGDCPGLIALADRPGMNLLYTEQKGLSLDCRNQGEFRAVVPWVVQNSQFTGRVSLFNAGDSDTSALLTAVSRSGDRVEKLIELPAKRVVTQSSEALFGSFTGYSLLIHSPSEQIYPSFLVFNVQACSKSSPAQTTGMRTSDLSSHLLFGYLPGDMVPAIVLLAPEVTSGTTLVDLALYTEGSDEPLAVQIELEANQPYARVVKDLFGLESLPTGASIEARSSNGTLLAGTTFVFNNYLEPSMALPFRLDP